MVDKGRLINEMNLAGYSYQDIQKVDRLKYSAAEIKWFFYAVNHYRLFGGEYPKPEKVKDMNPDLPLGI